MSSVGGGGQQLEVVSIDSLQRLDFILLRHRTCYCTTTHVSSGQYIHSYTWDGRPVSSTRIGN